MNKLIIINIMNETLQNETNNLVMSLVIDKIFPQHFRNYYFSATNKLGTTVSVVQVISLYLFRKR